MVSRRRLLAAMAGVGVVGSLSGARGARAEPPPARSRSQTTRRWRVAIVYGRSEAGKFDKGFNQLAFSGLEAARERHDLIVREFEPVGPGEEASMILQAAADADLVITVGYGLHFAALEAAGLSRDTRFSVIDAVVDHPRFQSLVFREHEAAFLAGLLAAQTSRSGVLGFVGAVATPVIERFRGGHRAGARYALPSIAVKDIWLGTTSEAYHTPFKGLLAAERLIAQGADVVFAAAGRSGFGVYQAAADQGVLAIGVDANQNFLHPGTMLTSVVKRVDTAVALSINALVDETWTPGVRSLGLREDGVALALDGHNRSLISDDRWEQVLKAREDLIAGRLVSPEKGDG